MSHDTEIPLPVALYPSDPLGSAKTFIQAQYRNDHGITLRHYGGVFYRYTTQGSYEAMEDATMRACLYAFLAKFRKGDTMQPFTPSAKNVTDVMDALRAVTHLPTKRAAPCWLDDAPGRPDPLDTIPCTNGLLHLPTRTVLPSTPQFFAFGALQFAYTADHETPHEWLHFLQELWPDDVDSQETLQEWLGYLLTSRTHFQKIMLLVGPPRSGKGTIGRVIQHLLGRQRVCAPTLSNIAQQFGLAVLLDKAAALIADARLGGRADTSILAERLLSISGEDPQTIPRKFLPDWNGPLPIRFTLMTNELPRIEDASGALASRFLLLVLRDSFLGREDHHLFDRLAPELPAIFHWALAGWERLEARGHFLTPASSAAVMQEFADLGSPIRAFLRESAHFSPAFEVRKDDFYTAWKRWCVATGRDHAGTLQVFARNLRAAVPSLTDYRPRIGGVQTEFWKGVKISPTALGND